MSALAAFLISALAGASPNATPAQVAPPPNDAVLGYVAPFQLLATISYGMTAVDSRPLVLDQRVEARVASGLRTVWYSCPNESPMTGRSGVTFDFKAGERYELVCRAGHQAEIRPAERC